MKKLFCCAVLFVSSLLLFTGCYYEPEPEIKHGEFPFRLEYEVNDKEYVIEDVLVCEFVGYRGHEAFHQVVEWKMHTKNKNRTDVVVLDLTSTTDLDKNGNDILYFYYELGTSEYYMDDTREWAKHSPQEFDCVYYWCMTPKGEKRSYSMTPEEAYEMHGIKYISFNIAPPIENTHREH